MKLKNKLGSRVWSCLIGLAMTAGFVPPMYLNASVEESNSIYSTQTEITAGAEEHIPFYVSGNTGFAGFVIYLTYRRPS